MSCPACERVARARIESDPFFLADLRESVAVLHKHQPFVQPDSGLAVGGWCTLWLRDHQEHLGLLSRERQARLAEDVGDVARAMHAALGPLGMRRVNYECLGNVVAHVHWHLIPRYSRPIDPEPGATVWVRQASELECGVDEVVRDHLVAALRRAFARR
ncbi:MAG: HIT family protein [Phycisphaerales bacterium]|nr:HIT family protein [Phycisphaerales bacterium]